MSVSNATSDWHPPPSPVAYPSSSVGGNVAWHPAPSSSPPPPPPPPSLPPPPPPPPSPPPQPFVMPYPPAYNNVPQFPPPTQPYVYTPSLLHRLFTCEFSFTGSKFPPQSSPSSLSRPPRIGCEDWLLKARAFNFFLVLLWLASFSLAVCTLAFATNFSAQPGNTFGGPLCFPEENTQDTQLAISVAALVLFDSIVGISVVLLPMYVKLGRRVYGCAFLQRLVLIMVVIPSSLYVVFRAVRLQQDAAFFSRTLGSPSIPLCRYLIFFISASLGLYPVAFIFSIVQLWYNPFVHFYLKDLVSWAADGAALEVDREELSGATTSANQVTTVNPSNSALWASGVGRDANSSLLPTGGQITQVPTLRSPSSSNGDSSRMEGALAAAEAVLELAGEHVPIVGAAFALLQKVLTQVRNMNRASYESSGLLSRLERLKSAVVQAGGDVAFTTRHAIMFESLVSSLNALAEVVVRVSERSTLNAFLLSGNDMKTLEKMEAQLSSHLIDFQTALQSETLSAVRSLGGASPRAPPPPFSMSFGLRDFALEPPLETQLKTGPRGSFGVCVFGTWRAQGIPVAIKLLPAAEGSGLNAWLEEAELMRRLRGEVASPNVVLLYGIGYDAPYYLVVMEKLEGSLRSALDGYCRTKRRPALSTALGWLRDTALGVQSCHSVNVCHSDIKAANVLLSESRVAKLGDLGTARMTRGLDATATRLTATYGGDAARGSPLWTAPELIDDPTMRASKACDVFSWALLAFEILSCLLPYHDEEGEILVNLERLSSKIDFVKGALRPDLSKVRPDTPPHIITLLQRAWSSSPEQRPTIDAIVEELGRV